MSKKIYITPQKQKPLRKKQDNTVEIVSIEKSKQPPGLLVEFLFRDFEQFGRKLKVKLPPLFLAGLTADLIKACGYEVRQGEKVDIGNLIGTILLAQFEPTEPEGGYQVVSFKTLVKEDSHG